MKQRCTSAGCYQWSPEEDFLTLAPTRWSPRLAVPGCQDSLEDSVDIAPTVCKLQHDEGNGRYAAAKGCWMLPTRGPHLADIAKVEVKVGALIANSGLLAGIGSPVQPPPSLTSPCVR